MKEEVLKVDFSTQGDRTCIRDIAVLQHPDRVGLPNKAREFYDIQVTPNPKFMEHEGFKSQWRNVAYRVHQYITTGSERYLTSTMEELCSTQHGTYRSVDDLRLGAGAYNTDTGTLTLKNLPFDRVNSKLTSLANALTKFTIHGAGNNPESMQSALTNPQNEEVLRDIGASKFDNLGQFFRR